jgi:hypothetical protein
VNDQGQVVLSLAMKDISVSPSSNNAVTITNYRVEYIRTDGRNMQGIDVPYAFDSGATGTIEGTTSLQIGFTLVRAGAKGQAPLVQLQSGGNVVSTIAKVTFYGADRVGNAISVTGQLQVDFGYFPKS